MLYDFIANLSISILYNVRQFALNKLEFRFHFTTFGK